MTAIILAMWIFIGIWLVFVLAGKEKFYIFKNRLATYLIIAACVLFFIFLTSKIIRFNMLVNQSKSSDIESDILNVAAAMAMFKKDVGRFPKMQEGLEALIDGKKNPGGKARI